MSGTKRKKSGKKSKKADPVVKDEVVETGRAVLNTGIMMVPNGAGTEKAEKEIHEMDSTCDFCKAPIYSGKAVKCDICGAIMHQFCFNSHAISKHRPDHTIIEVITKSVYDENGAFKGQKSNYHVVANV